MILYKDLIKNKKNINFICICTLLLIISIVCIFFTSHYDYIENEVIGQKPINRTLYVDSEDTKIFEQLSQDKRIEKIYYKYNLPAVYKKQELILNSTQMLDYDVELKDNEIAISNYFAENYKLKQGNSFKLEIFGQKHQFVIKQIIQENYNRVFVSLDQIENIAKSLEVQPSTIIVRLNKYKDINEIKKELSKKEIYSDLENSVGEDEIKEVRKLKSICMLITFIVITIINISILILYYSKDYEEKDNYKLLNIIGFSRFKLLKLTFNKKNIIIGMSIFIAIIMLLITQWLSTIFKINVISNSFQYLNYNLIYLEIAILLLLNIIESTYFINQIKET